MSQFSPSFGVYYAGIWERHLILSLQWGSLDTSIAIGTRHMSRLHGCGLRDRVQRSGIWILRLYALQCLLQRLMNLPPSSAFRALWLGQIHLRKCQKDR
jgi:hypothetical protein